MANDRPWLLAETTWKAVRETTYQVALLPWGATEAHNHHLPYATDVIETAAVAAESARLAWQRDARAVVLPTIPFGVNTGQRDIPLCINMNPSTQARVLGDVVDSVERAGIRRLVIVNGHGGNDFRAMIRELQPRTTVFICIINWYSCIDPRPYFAEPGDHAGELETSLVQHLRADLVLPIEMAGTGAARPFAVRGLREGWAWAPRRWTDGTDDTGVGDPRHATPDKGARFFAAVTERLATFLVDLAAADPDRMHAEPD